MTRYEEVIICINHFKNEMRNTLQDITEAVDVGIDCRAGTQLVVLSKELDKYIKEYKEYKEM